MKILATLGKYLKFNETFKRIRKLNTQNINNFYSHVNQCFSFSKGKSHSITGHRN